MANKPGKSGAAPKPHVTKAGKKKPANKGTPEKFKKENSSLKTKSSWGGKRAGAGRPHGDKDRRDATILARRQAPGIDPLEYLLTLVGDVKLDTDTRRQAARDAVPYLRPRLNAVAVAAPSESVMGTFLASLPSSEELRKAVRGLNDPVAQAKLIKSETEKSLPIEKKNPVAEKKKQAQREALRRETEDRLADYRDKSLGHGKPLEPEYT